MIDGKMTGIMIYYYFVCKRKLWLFCNGISLEDENEDVRIGKFIDESTYSSERKHILINGEINIDFIRHSGIIHEIKKSRKIEEASIWQVKYYLFYLKKHGVGGVEAKIDYPLLKQSIYVLLTDEDEVKIRDVIKEIDKVLSYKNIPKRIIDNRCKKCAFYDICMI